MINSRGRNLQAAAMMRVHRAVADGSIVKPDRCDICGMTEDQINAGIAARRGNATRKYSVLHAHHHKGYKYDNALDVWWICTQCNAMLWGKHDGSLTLEDARQMYQRKIGASSVVLAGGRVWTRLE